MDIETGSESGSDEEGDGESDSESLAEWEGISDEDDGEVEDGEQE